MDSQRFNLTKGDILGKLLMVSVPIIGTQLMLLGYNLVDMFLLGRVSADAVASSGSAGMYLWLGAGVMLIGRMGAEIGVAQAKGRGDSLAALSFSHNSLFLAGLLGTFCAAVSLMFSSQLIRFLNIQEAHVAAEAERYLFIVAFGMPAVFLSSAVAGSFTGAGNSRTPFVINAIGLALNAALDPLFIFTLEMGVAGAAVATIIAQNAACVLSFYWLLRRKDRPFPEYPLFRPPAGDCIKTILRWTIPVSVENLLFTFFAMLVARYVADYGAAAITVSRVGSQIESLCWLICLGFSSGLTAFVGQNFGAGKWSRIRTGLRKSLLFSCSWGLFVSLMFFTIGGFIVSLFVPDPLIVEMGTVYLRILAFCQIFFCLESIAAGAFRGIGRTLPPSIGSIISNCIRIPAAHLLSQTELGLNGIWLAVTLTASLRGFWIFTWFLIDLRRRPKRDVYATSNPDSVRMTAVSRESHLEP